MYLVEAPKITFHNISFTFIHDLLSVTKSFLKDFVYEEKYGFQNQVIAMTEDLESNDENDNENDYPDDFDETKETQHK